MGSAGILARDAISDEIQWINIDPCYVYHPLNAYDEGNYIVPDVVRHNYTFIGRQLEGGDDLLMEGAVAVPCPTLVKRAAVSRYFNKGNFCLDAFMFGGILLC